LNLSRSIGWAVGPFISGVVQQNYGFAPLFIATAVLYFVAVLLQWKSLTGKIVWRRYQPK